MPRKPRVHVPGGFYHLVLRGNARRAIFHDQADRENWQRFLCEAASMYQARVHAYCWMTNHVHIAAQVSNQPVGRFIGVVATRYAKAYNRKYQRSGHLFERRHRAILVRDDSQLLQLVRYIHQNPVRANLVSKLSQYHWSSHAAYLGAESPIDLTTKFVLSLFSNDRASSRQQYAQFMGEPTSPAVIKEINSESSSDMDVHGSCSHDNEQPGTENCESPESLDQMIERLCQEHGISEFAMTDSSRIHSHARIRAIITLAVVDKGLASISELARRFNRAQPTLSRAVNNLRRERNKL